LKSKLLPNGFGWLSRKWFAYFTNYQELSSQFFLGMQESRYRR